MQMLDVPAEGRWLWGRCAGRWCDGAAPTRWRLIGERVRAGGWPTPFASRPGALGRAACGRGAGVRGAARRKGASSFRLRAEALA